MIIYKQKIQIESKIQTEFIDITEKVQEIVEVSGAREGQVLVYAPHTTMGVVINHNEAMLIQDFTRVLNKLAPVDEQYAHDLFELRQKNRSDGRSNGNSHCKNLFLGISETIPLGRRKLLLTSLQSIFAVELDGPRKRDLWIQVIGE